MNSYAETLERIYAPARAAVGKVASDMDEALGVFAKYPPEDQKAMAELMRTLGRTMIEMADVWERERSK